MFAAMERVLRLHRVEALGKLRTLQTTGTDMKSILDPSFRYTQSVETDLRKTFARIRREQRKQAAPATNVQPIRRDPKLRVTAAR